MITGIVQRIQTLADATVRLSVDIPRELCPDDIMTWLYESAKLIKEDDYNGIKENTDNQDSAKKGKRQRRTNY